MTPVPEMSRCRMALPTQAMAAKPTIWTRQNLTIAQRREGLTSTRTAGLEGDCDCVMEPSSQGRGANMTSASAATAISSPLAEPWPAGLVMSRGMAVAAMISPAAAPIAVRHRPTVRWPCRRARAAATALCGTSRMAKAQRNTNSVRPAAITAPASSEGRSANIEQGHDRGGGADAGKHLLQRRPCVQRASPDAVQQRIAQGGEDEERAGQGCGDVQYRNEGVEKQRVAARPQKALAAMGDAEGEELSSIVTHAVADRGFR